MKETRKGIKVFEGESKPRGTAQKHRKHTMAGLAWLKAPKVGLFKLVDSWFDISSTFSNYVIFEP